VLAAQWHKQGMYYQQIAERLNQLGKLSPGGKPWRRLSIRQLLVS
jgi:hypothetical protein